MEIIVLAHSTHNFLLKGFSHLFNKYWSPNTVVTVYGDERPLFPLPNNFRFRNIPNYPFERWSDSLFDVLTRVRDDRFILMLEDYWLTDYVDYKLVLWIDSFMRKSTKDILRVDLSNDRATHPHKVFSHEGDITLIQSLPGTEYQMSFQAAMWNKESLMRCLRLGESAHQAEIDGSDRLGRPPLSNLRVYGTLNRPLKYSPVYRFKRNLLRWDGLNQQDVTDVRHIYEFDGIPLSAISA